MIPAPGLGRRLRGLLDPVVDRAAATPGADRYRKHFPLRAHLWILLVHVLDGAASLRQTHARLRATDFAGLDLPRGISFSQLARSSTSRDPAGIVRLFADLVAAVRPQADPVWHRLERVQVVDATFLALSAKLSPWSRHGGHAPGVRLQTGFDLAGAIPSALRLTLADTHDTTALGARDLAALAGWTVVIDLGYYGHRRFAELRAAGVSLICRLHPQAAYRVTADHPVPPITTPDGDVVLADQTITLGSPHNRAGAVLPGMRLVTSCNGAGEEQRFVTDRGDLAAADVVALYRKRWQIELFFRWLKHQLNATHPLGHSRAAVWLTVLLCAIVALVLMLLTAARPRGVTRIAFARALAVHLTTPDPTDTS
jgi:Transposase DDE domain